MFFISVHGHGRGGHFNSLYHIANKLAEENKVGVVSIGPGFSPVISESSNFVTHIDFNGLNFFRLKFKVDRLIKKHKPNVIHCFDVGSYNILRMIYSPRKNKIALNKCGGPNPIKYPYVKNLVLFSIEDMEWFKKNKRYNDSNIFLIPNRVSKVKVKSLDIQKVDGCFTFLRIARIGKTYKKSILDSISLIELLLERNKSLKVKLYIIGVVECIDTLSEIKENKLIENGTVVILTDDKYTVNASKMLYLADAVIGTGRSVMEAASLALPVLTINSLNNIPVLVDIDTFNDAFRSNFSERNIFPKIENEGNILKVEKVISDMEFYDEVSSYINNKFIEYFDIESASVNYSDFYKGLSLSNKKIAFEDFVLFLKTLYGFFKSSKK